MGRIAEKGLDYFPLDTTWETAVKLVKAKFGACKGAGFLAELWASIYRENYYRAWNEETELLFADEIKEEVGWVHEAIEYCFDKQIFDRDIFKAKGVLTGHGIQKRYFQIARDKLKRVGLDYIDGITYPKYMPENNHPKNKDNLQGKADNLQGKADNLGGYDHKGKGKGRGREGEGEGEIKGEGKYPPALVDNSPEYEEALFRFTLAILLARKKKPGDPESMARKIMHEEDVERDFRKIKGIGERSTSVTFIAPDPGPCPKCGGELHANGYVGAANCRNCPATFTYNRDFDEWLEDAAEPVPFPDTG